MPDTPARSTTKPRLVRAEPQLFVADVGAACGYFTGTLGFRVVFAHGEPPFYAQVQRDGAALNLRHVDAPLMDAALRDREDYLAAAIPVEGVAELEAEFLAAGAVFHQRLRTEPWGARTIIVKDPDGNLLLFAE